MAKADADTDPVEVSDDWLDGNAAAGLLGAIFPFEMTMAVGTCDGCGATAEFAALIVFSRAPGLVVRCPGCEAVLLRIVEGPSRYWLDLRGLRSLELRDESLEPRGE